MKSNITKRLDEIEREKLDWIAHLDVLDYGFILESDYEADLWEEVYFDKFITAVRHKETGEVCGYYRDRRSDAQIKSEGGLLEFL